ncbi:MAG: 23S rRNA (uracil(1939)-C(5))-methyltransferase RlmD [Acidobacteriota bacterium]
MQLALQDLSSTGRGVGRTEDGRVVMVRGGIPGDQVVAVVTTRRKSFVEAKIETLLRPSPHRVEPRCRHAHDCGGCSLQQMDPAAQRQFKVSRIRELLQRSRKLPGVPVGEAEEVGSPFGYRNRMEFSFSSASGGLVAGLHAADGKVFDLTECHLPDLSLVRALDRIRAILRARGLSAHDARPTPGPLERLELRRSAQTGEILAVLRATSPLSPGLQRDLANLVHEGGGPHSVVVLDPRYRCLAGPGEVWEGLGNIRLPVVPGAFTQTHTAGALAVYEAVLRWLARAPGGGLLDLYAGSGPVSLLARGFDPVVAVEVSAASIRAGRRAAARNGKGIRFIHAPALEGARTLQAAGLRFAAVAVNPPRAGLHADLPAVVRALGARRLAYVSCHPATLVRDLERLSEEGFVPEAILTFDLFPHTAEIEAVARLRREEDVAGEEGRLENRPR